MSCTVHQFSRGRARCCSQCQAGVSQIMQMEVWAPDNEPGLRPRSLKGARSQRCSSFSCEEKSVSFDYRKSLQVLDYQFHHICRD
jgi:hypothetical protein